MANIRHNLLGLNHRPADPGTLTRSASPTPGPLHGAWRVSHLRSMLAHHAAAPTCTTSCPMNRAPAGSQSLGGWSDLDLMNPLDGSFDLQAYYRQLAVDIARENLHVRETGTNRGEEVEEFTESTGGIAGYAWCSSFAYWCHEQAAERLGGLTTMPATYRAVFVWYESLDVNLRYRPDDVTSGAVWPEPGDAFVMTRRASAVRRVVADTRKRTSGHAGLVRGYDAARQVLLTIEGNTNGAGSAEGDGVYERERRLDSSLLVGCVRPQISV